MFECTKFRHTTYRVQTGTIFDRLKQTDISVDRIHVEELERIGRRYDMIGQHVVGHLWGKSKNVW